MAPTITIDLDAVSQIIVISNDALGPPSRAICVTMVGRTPIFLEKSTDIANFVARLDDKIPEVAQAVSQELKAKDRPSNYETVIFDRNW
ncbi:MAG: hypothetical protein M3O30_12005 [Planctomycetota bacterium]|nr:hypothetical protein [Planctomycetota bacterium]